MKAGITFIDALERHQQNPLTFPIPRNALKRSIRVGDLVKIGVEGFESPVGDGKAIDGERFWLRVTQVHEQSYEGTITNDLFFTEEHELDCGDNLAFEERNILDVETIEEQTLPKVPGTPVVTITPEMLTEVLPRISAAECALDDHAHLMVGRLNTNELMATVILHRVTDRKTLVALNAAAKSLGLVPKALEEAEGMTGLCKFAIMLPTDVDGPELLKRVHESIDAVRREAARMMSGDTSDALQSPLVSSASPLAAETIHPAAQDPASDQTKPLPPWVVESCPQCMHGFRMGTPIPDDEITPAIFELLCPNCRVALPFDKQGCPISHEQLMELFDFVEEQFASRQGDETLRFAGEFCDREHLPKAATLDWLRGQGGYCDIEVVMNVAPRWSE